MLHYSDLLPAGKSRQFTWSEKARSVSTSPSGSMQPLAKDGHDEITGLAWSGRGTVKRVDISTDGGWNWARAQLQSPIINLAR